MTPEPHFCFEIAVLTCTNVIFKRTRHICSPISAAISENFGFPLGIPTDDPKIAGLYQTKNQECFQLLESRSPITKIKS